MKALYDQFGTNQEKEQEGAWIYYDEDLAFKVKRICPRNKAFMLATEKIEKKKRRGELPEKEEAKVTAALFVDCSLLDWKGVVDDAEKPIPFNKANAVALLTNPKWPDFAKDLFSKAQDNTYFKDLETESKN